MNNFAFLKNYLQLQKNIMYDKIVDFNFAMLSFCKIDKSSYWNLALTNKSLEEKELLQIERKFRELKRSSTVYFENKRDLLALIVFLIQHGYEKTFEDSWMFFTNHEISHKFFNNVKKVKNENDLDKFLQTFNNCYQKDDPQNVYGELGDYLIVAEKAWHQHHKTNRLEYFIVFDNDEPVAVSTLTNFQNIGYISNVGSLPKVRGKGFGKLITLFAVWKSQKRGNVFHCLATEEKTYPNEFYKRIGFKTLFTALGYTKKSV